MIKNQNIFFKKEVSIFACLFLFLGHFAWNQTSPVQNATTPSPEAIEKYQHVITQTYPHQASLKGSESLGRLTAFDAYTLVLQWTITTALRGNESTYHDYLKATETIEEHLNSLDHGPFPLFVLADLHLQKALIQTHFNDELSAIWSFKRAVELINHCQEDYPAFLPVKKTSGIIYILLGSVPNEYQWLLSILGWEGDINMGLAQLKQLTNDPVWGLEASIYYYITQSYLLDNYDLALQEMSQKTVEYPNSELLRYIYAALLLKNGKAQSVIKLPSGATPVPQFYYMKGEAFLRKGAYHQAIANYNLFLNKCQGSDLIKDSHYKLFLCYYLGGDEQKAADHLKRAGETGSTRVESDRYASRQLSQPFVNKPLMQVRLATDGGFYKRADSLLNINISMFNPKETAEYYYRKARLCHETAQIEKALIWYQTAIRASGNQTWYFGPNAALKSGEIYIQQGEEDKAKEYLKLTLSYKNHEYKRSIDRKAKALLNQLGFK